MIDQYTTTLLHFDNGFKDERNKIWTPHGNAKASTAKKRFGEKSLRLSGSGNWLSTPSHPDFIFGSGDFTIDWWEYAVTNINSSAVLSKDDNNNACMVVGRTYNGNKYMNFSSTNSSWDLVSSVIMGVSDLLAWNHWAVVRASSNIYSFKNGIITSTNGVGASSVANNSTMVVIGMEPSDYIATANCLDSYIDELRVSKGIARWAANFIPPSRQYGTSTKVDRKSTLVLPSLKGGGF